VIAGTLGSGRRGPCNPAQSISSSVLGFGNRLDGTGMRKLGWIAGAVGLLAASCKDDGSGDPQTADTTGADAGTDDQSDDDPTTNPSGPDTDPDDTGSTGDGPGTDPDATGPADTSTGDPIDPIDPDALDDEFDDGLDGWSTFNEQLASIAVEGGALHMEPGAGTVWLDAATATLVHKPVAGDFKVTAAVTARGLTNPDAPPPAGFRFGGLMARDPGGGAENYVFIVLGTDEDPSVETKTTVDSSSTYQGPPWPGATGEIRICRVGATFGMYVREAGGAWQQSNTFERADLPAELAVGPIAYNNDATPNVRVSFDFVDFEPVAGPDECTQ